MIDPSIAAFFQDRISSWCKKNINDTMSDMEIRQKKIECEQKFSLENWLPDAARRAGQMSISTHPCTFSHPSSRKNKNGYASSVIASSEPNCDGYLRSGNVAVESDAVGNAAVLDVYKFLTLNMENGQSLLTHIQEDSELATSLLSIKTESYETIKSGFLAMMENGEGGAVTSSKIKQVYFPTEEKGYHQLSLLSASGIMFELRKRIDHIRFSDETNEARIAEKANESHQHGYKQLPGLVTIGFGGTKPQNISVLNNQNGGKAHLLPCIPPKIHKRNIRFPTKDFFRQTINYFQCRDLFYDLHRLFKKFRNDWNIRAERDSYYQSILDHIIQIMWETRKESVNQFFSENSQLDKTQKIWLCHKYETSRFEEEEWLDDLCQRISRFIFNGYAKILGKNAIMFSDEEFKHIHKLVVDNREALR